MTLPYQNLTDEERDLIFKPASRTLKRQLIKQGYEYQLSIYGVKVDKNTNKSEYRRIEILSNTSYTETLVHQLYYFFNQFIPRAKYTIWTYSKLTDDLDQKGVYE